MKHKVAIISIMIGLGLIAHAIFFTNSVPLVHDVEQVASSTSETVPVIVQTTQEVSPLKELSTNKTFNSKASLKIGTDSYVLNFNKGEVMYDGLKRLKDEGKITLKGRDFDRLGFFIESINNLVPVSPKSIIYYINGKSATTGVSNQIINDGDVIEFKVEDTY